MASKIHEEIKHIGVRYPCPECEYLGTTAGVLKNHIESKHEGVRYPCLQCEHAATTAGALKNMLKVYTKECDILVLNATMPPLEQPI